MRRALLVVGLALAAFAAVAPIVEAAFPCEQTCAGDENGMGCSADACCSCCVHVRVVWAGALAASPSLLAAAKVESLELPHILPAPPRRIPHVPKSFLA
jgi:hypothetical protein